jgi:hypothetical protein
MNKEQREVYQVLTAEAGACLCTFCKYSKFTGSSCNEDAECECKHPLTDKTFYVRFDETCYPGEDCWGFRPNHPLSEIADVIGIVLSEGFENWYYDYAPAKGIATVYGRKSKSTKEARDHDQANLPV